jgi:type IV pilus assembly protein PilA
LCVSTRLVAKTALARPLQQGHRFRFFSVPQPVHRSFFNEALDSKRFHPDRIDDRRGDHRLPAYQDYTVRAKVSEGVIAASSAKGLISEAFQADGINGMTAAATAYNLIPQAQKQSKYVDNITITEGSPWTITMSVAATAGNGIPTSLNQNQLAFSPNVQNVVPVDTSVGAIDWACTSASPQAATNRGLGNRPLPAGTALPAKYAPAECR